MKSQYRNAILALAASGALWGLTVPLSKLALGWLTPEWLTVALGALAAAGTLLPFWLFARGQARVPAELAGAFVNLEPLVGAAIGWIAFGNVAGPLQLTGVVAVLAGIGMSAVPAGTAARARLRIAARARLRIAAGARG